jgi:hypothetical protein
MPEDVVPEPWSSFLDELDNKLDGKLVEPISLECVGGFVITLLYGLARPTSDIDVIEVAPSDQARTLVDIAAEGSAMYKKHKLYIDLMGGIVTLPEDYKSRLQPMFHGRFRNLRFFALDSYDIALSKIGRNIERDREDISYLAEKAPVDLDTLKKRYFKELRPYVVEPIAQRYDTTLNLWIDMIEEQRGAG